jgi:hypothetical protein
VIFSQHFQHLSFSTNHEKSFRTFGQNYLKQRHFELFPKSGGFYSLRSDPVFFQRSDPDPAQNGPDPPTMVSINENHQKLAELWIRIDLNPDPDLASEPKKNP